LYLFLKFKLINQINNFSRFLGQTERVIKDTDIVRQIQVFNKSHLSSTEVLHFCNSPQKRKKKSVGRGGERTILRELKQARQNKGAMKIAYFFT